MYKPSEEELQTWCAKWQKILSLKHWSVQVKYEKKHRMAAGSYAEVFCKTGILSAVIKIMDPMDYDDPYIPQNIELSLLHELIHIPLMMLLQGKWGAETAIRFIKELRENGFVENEKYDLFPDA